LLVSAWPVPLAQLVMTPKALSCKNITELATMGGSTHTITTTTLGTTHIQPTLFQLSTDTDATLAIAVAMEHAVYGPIFMHVNTLHVQLVSVFFIF